MNEFNFIDNLVDDLRPVKRLSRRTGFAIISIVVILAMAAIIFGTGMRGDLAAGQPAPMFLLRSGMLILLGGVTAHALLAMASPSVGRHNNGWVIALGAAALFPIVGLVLAVINGPGVAASMAQYGAECLQLSLISALAISVPMVLHLRKGAPTSPERAGWLTGIAAGGFGGFAYNLHCPFNDITYIGLYYGLAVTISAILGRIIVPRLIRW
ncbi:hypothetical protein LPB140_05200 [Sphingorhabdus lutea]|uniref:DUF1109 domain-containing protein n=1 Tax=Sphingorhabdus lutea TaxID=1913578 RepID=A0A1L3JB00_9SPHN|nr:DUF1109 domain-containing protein [Sphingorhabdus lutea]APG62302.1 hypothetical protein LPB140_05200 [Sphingorhabdus lutea]